MTYLVTGVAGFIGSHILARLLREGERVIGIDNFSSSDPKKVETHRENSRFVFRKQDITYFPLNLFSNESIDCVIHLAAIPHHLAGLNQSRARKVNEIATLALLDLCSRFGVKRFVFASTYHVYGSQYNLPVTETLKPNPDDFYGETKCACELKCREAFRVSGLETITLRLFSAFGPGQTRYLPRSRVIPLFLEQLEQNKIITIYGNGEQKRDFIFIDDLVEAFIQATQTENRECYGRTFNIGSGIGTSINELAKEMMEMHKGYVEPVYISGHGTDQSCVANIDLAKKLLDWSPKTSFRDGLQKTYDWHFKREKELFDNVK